MKLTIYHGIWGIWNAAGWMHLIDRVGIVPVRVYTFF